MFQMPLNVPNLRRVIMDELESKVVKLCSEYLSGPWSDTSNVKVRKLTQGFGNRNFHCSLKAEAKSNVYPSNVVVHIYGSELTGNESTIKMNGEAGEALIVNTLQRIGIAPKLLGVFPGGRIEEYIPSTTCSLEDFANPVVNKLLARKLALIHSLDMPIPKVPNKVTKWKEMFTKMLTKDGKNLEGENCDVFKEFDWYQSIITQISGQTVFNHGDTNPNNILVIRDESNNVKDVMFIDYEICCYFYRSTDIANIFIARHMKFENVDGKLKMTMADEEFRKDSETLEKEFLEEYLKEWKLLRGGQEESQDCLENLEMEVDFSRLFIEASYIFFIENFSDKIDPSCQKYIEMADYDNRKQRIIQKYASKLQSLANEQ